MSDTHDAPVSADALDRLLRPRRIAMVGASDKNLFSRRSFAQHHRVASSIDLTLVNPRTAVVHGVETVPTCADVPGGIDCAYLMTPHSITIQALEEAAAVGGRAGVVLSQGWAEEGPEGKSRQDALVQRARELDVLLLGPNHLGFANLWDGVAACALGLDMPIEPGHLALVSQSGAVGSSLVGYAARQDVRFSFVVTTGNESMVTVSDVVHHLVDDENTKAIAVFAETIRKPEVFRAAARKAADLGKAIVILKAGSSELAAQTAQAHTGALVGDDRVIDAVLRQEGVIRVDSLEDLICTGALCAGTGPLRADGVAVLSVSGGACDLIADRGEVEGLHLPEISTQTAEALAAILPPYGHPQNPLDVTGGALADPEVWRKGIEAMAREESVGLIGVVTSLPTGGEPQREETFHAVGQKLAECGLPGVIFPQVETVQSEEVCRVKRESGVPNVLPSVDRFVPAAARLARWSRWLKNRPHTAQAPQAGATYSIASTEGPVSENQGRGLLAEAGIPAVPAVLATTADEAATAAEDMAGAVVLKMSSAQVAHKTELGGVELNVVGEDAVRASFGRLTDRADAAGVSLDGVLVSPMRTGGVELLVGVTRDDDWGLILAVALGGQLVELLDDSALRVLPVGRDDVRAMLGELRGRALLDGFRGSKPADVDAVVDAVVAIADLATGLGDEIESLEVNPLLVDGDRVEALDVLVTRRSS